MKKVFSLPKRTVLFGGLVMTMLLCFGKVEANSISDFSTFNHSTNSATVDTDSDKRESGIFHTLMSFLDVNVDGSSSNSNDCCEGGDKPIAITFTYTGDGCNATNTSQDSGKFDCSGDPNNDPSVYIVVNNEEDNLGGDVWFAGNVALGGTFTMAAANAGEDKFDSKSFIHILSSQGGSSIQEIEIHTSCSAPLVIGEQIGSARIESIIFQNGFQCEPPLPPEECPTPSITIPTGQICQGDPVVFSTPDLGFPCLEYTWTFGLNASPMFATGVGPHTVTFNQTGNFDVELTIDNGCDPTVPSSMIDCCDSGEKVRAFTMQFLGGGCNNSNDTQDDKSECDDFGGLGTPSSVYIVVSEDDDGGGDTYFQGTVDLNGSFTADAANVGDDKLPSKVFFNIYSSQGGSLLQRNEIHASCSAPVVTGERFGGLLLQDVILESGSLCSNGNFSAGTGSGDGFVNVGNGVICPETSSLSSGIDCCDSGEKVRAFTMQLLGGSCNNSNDTQDDKSECDDFGGLGTPASTYIVVSEDDDGGGDVYFQGTVNLNDSFTADAANVGDDKLPSKVFFNIYSSQGGSLLQRNEIHASCSAPVVTGERFGGLLLQDVILENGGLCSNFGTGSTGDFCVECRETATITILVEDCNNQAMVGDKVFNDGNGNGIQNAGEAGIDGVTVKLQTPGGVTLETQVTENGGMYKFMNLDPGQYKIMFNTPAGFNPSPKTGNATNNNNTDSDNDPDTQMTDVFTLNEGDNKVSVDAGYIPIGQTASVGDKVFSDTDGDGIQDAGEPGIDGVTVKLQTTAGVTLQTTTTANGGLYLFDNLTPDDYKIMFNTPAGFTGSPKTGSAINNNNTDSDNDPITEMTDPFTLSAGDAKVSVDAGFVPIPQTASVGDFVFNDLDGDGIQDANEPGIDGVTVKLQTPNGATLQTTTTANGGAYTFTGLNPGDYKIMFNTPAGFTGSPKTGSAINNNNTDSDNDPATQMTDPFTLSPGDDKISVDAGFVPDPNQGSIGDFVFQDTDGDGIQDPNEPGVPNVTVQLKNCANTVLQTTTTNANGAYNFGNLDAGCYRIQVLLPNGFSPSPQNQGGNDAVDSDINPTTLMTGNINLGQGEDDPSNDAGLVPDPNQGSIGDFVFQDTDGDGIQDPNEPGVPNVTVQLKNCANTVLQTTTTNANGAYNFGNLDAGCYRIQVLLPNGFSPSPQNQGGNDAVDSDINPTTLMTGNINLGQGEDDPSNDAGLVPDPNQGSIGDFVFQDTDGDGIQDPNEPGVPNVTVQLKNCANTVLQTTTTNANGAYNFGNLDAGCYRIQVLLPNGFSPSPQNQGGNDAVDSDINPTTLMTGNINLDPGEDDDTVDAGLVPVCEAEAGTVTAIGPMQVTLVNGTATISAFPNGDQVIPTGYQLLYVLTAGNDLVIQATSTNPSFTVSAIGKYTIHTLVYDPSTLDLSIVVSGQTTGVDVVNLLIQGGGDICASLLVDGAMFMIVEPNQGSIGDLVFQDNNGNGIQNPGEPGVPNVTVQLKNCANVILQTTTTNAAGIYSFSNLNSGCYRIQIVLPNGFSPSPQNQGGNDNTDSDINPTSLMTGNINLAQGQDDTSNDAGLVPNQNPCDNITNGGVIGFGNSCQSSVLVCDQAVPQIKNCVSPSGGSGNLEIIWLKATNNPNCNLPTQTITNISNDPFWSVIPGETGLTLNPGSIDTKTCYLRCARRAGCDTYVESNIISADIDPNCGGGGEPNCDTDISISTQGGTLIVSGLGGAPISSLQVFNSSWQTEYSCFANCNATETLTLPVGTYYVYAKYYTASYQLICQKTETVTITGGGGCTDNDNDGVCAADDCDDNNPNIPAPVGSPCNDGSSSTDGDVIQPDGCTCLGEIITTNPCDNITNGGIIGFGNSCQSSALVCDQAVPQIKNCVSPSGGSGSLEIIWLKATNNPNCNLPTQPISNISNDPVWSIIPGATGLTLNPGNITTKTCYLRCTRRAGCDTYVESNIISADIDPNCGGGGEPNCDTDISISTQSGALVITGLGVAPISSLQVFNSSWQTEYSCFANCSATETLNLPVGTYYVYAKYYTASYQLICQKTETVTITAGGGCTDNDNDGVCAADDCDDNNPNIPAPVGSACDDGSSLTDGDVIQPDGCTCSGEIIVTNPCANAGGDADNDGVCANIDCDDNNPNVPATPGTACNDGNGNTTNDVIQSDGCTCAGTPIGGGDPDCNDISITTGSGTIVVSGLAGAPVSSLQIFNAQWQQEFSCFGNCDATQTVQVSPGTYRVYAKYYTAGYTPICQEVQIVTVTNGGGGNGGCQNLTNGGTVGFYNHCGSTADYCPGEGSVEQIRNCTNPSGGTGTIEYIWLKSTVSATPPTSISDPNWQIIGGATLNNYYPSAVSQTTYFIRCGRRAGCLNYIGESNVVTVLVTPGCGNGNGGPTAPDCSDITIGANNGDIIVTGLDGAPITSVQIFNAAWGTEFSCFADCDVPTQSVSVSDGTYHVYVKYYSANYSQVCKVDETINVTNGQASIAQGDDTSTGLTFQMNKWEEHTEAMWAHNEGHLVETYTLERSADGENFVAISTTASEGTQLTTTYQGYDIEPMKGDNYYRLRMDYQDGFTAYSDIKKVHFTDVIDFSLFPNPANHFVKVNLEEVLGQEVDIKIYNNLGQELKAVHLDEVYSKYYQMDLQELKEGHYTVWLNVPGRRAVAKKLVIGRI